MQRVKQAAVHVDGNCVGRIDRGWLILFAVHRDDTIEDLRWLADKCVDLRAFSDEQGKMNRSVIDIGGEMLIVSQFTLAGDCRKGRRPSFDNAAEPSIAKQYYEMFCQHVAQRGVPVQKGIFQADMQVSLVNDGPVTFVIDPPTTSTKGNK
jgi:D-tyrosyl-tRNA(Tyr) deacylase